MIPRTSRLNALLPLLVLCVVAAACTSNTQGQPIALREPFPQFRFTNPVDLQNAGDGSNRLFVVEQRGVIRVFENSPSADSARLFLDIKGRLVSGGEMGLLGLAFHPAFSDNGYFYVNYTAEDPLRTVIARFNRDSAHPEVADSNSEVVLLTFNQPYPNHNGGQIAFGPDGYLYIATGDGGDGGDPHNNGQTRSNLLGKILRINVDSVSPGLSYSIPADNPYFGNTAGYRQEIYAYGLRNPWRFSFDPVTGWLWAGDVGQGAWEEVDIVEKGKNYGWRRMEGFHCYPPGSSCDTTGLTLPIWEYDHDLGVSITGGHLYRGSRVPDLVGEYIYGDFASGRIWGLRYNGTGSATNRLLLASGRTISSFGVDEANEIYLCSFNGRIYTIDPKPAADVKPEAGSTLQLFGNNPNPFSSATLLRYRLDHAAHVELVVRNILGGIVATLVDEEKSAGEHVVPFDGTAYPAGVYYYTITHGGGVARQGRMILAK